MTTKHSHPRHRVVALTAALAALSTPIMSATASGARSTTTSVRPAAAAARPAVGSARPAAPARLPVVLLPAFNPTDLCARAGTTTMPNGANVQVWGYETGDCTGPNTITKPGGPVITVNAGDTVSIVLHNGLGLPAETTSLLFQGQAIPPDTTGAPMGGTATYTFTASNPGTYLYEAGLTANGQHQVAMGLYGALIVRPSGAPSQAYDIASTVFDDEAVLVLGELDTALNNSANKANFDMRNFKPKYFTINGTAYSATDPIPTTAGSNVLLRYVNAGITYHSMSLLGGSQQIIAYDGNPLTYPHSVAAETFGPGQTVDALVSISPTTADGTKLAVYDANLLLNNSTASGFGGMMTFINVTAVVVPGDTTGPLVTAVGASPNPSNGTGSVTLTATAADPSDVVAAEYRIDSGPAVAFTGIVQAPSVALTATIAAPTVQGGHSIQVRAQDALLNWSGWSGTTLVVDSIAPTISNLTLNPNPSSGSTNVVVHATATDGNTVVAAEYQVDGGAPVAFTVTAAGTASLDASITPPTPPAPGSVATHLIELRARDLAGNWSTFSSISMVLDRAGPTMTAATVYSNGVNGFNSSTPAARITGTVTDGNSSIVAAEGFIDNASGVAGTGFLFVPQDGSWNSPTEIVTADIPLTTINSMTVGTHHLYLHGKDAPGNWGTPMIDVLLLIDKIVPVVNSPLTATPNPASTAVTLDAAGSDNLAGANRVEWFTGTDPGRGLASAMNITGSTTWTATTSIDVSAWASGSYTLSVRARDAAQNWSVIRTIAVTVSRGQLYFSTLGNTNPPSLAGTVDDADIYGWLGTFSRTVDVTTIANAVPAGANVDGLEFTDGTHFYLSFAADTTLPVLGLVQDEDVVFYNAGVWSVYFDGTSHGLGANANQDIDEFAIVGGDLYYSTRGSTNPTGVGGTADDADIYLWNGATTTRFWDASANGVLAAANVDGIAVVDATHFYLSFAADTTVTGLGAVQDEDVVKFSAGTWSTWFDGTSLGLTNANHDLDAIDVP